MKILPFRLSLAGLTLKGKHYDVAEAHYNLTGEALERRLLIIGIDDETHLKLALLRLDIKYERITEEHYDTQKAELTLTNDDLVLELLSLKRKYKHISKEEYDYELVEIKYKNSKFDTDLSFARYELDKKYGKLTEKEFDKAVYSLGNRPWVDVIHSEYNDNDKSDGFIFELDWNDAFIIMLRDEGYNGNTDESIVEQWFEDKSIDTYLGVLSEQMAEIGEDPKDAHSIGRPGGRTVREQLGDSRIRHS